MSKHRVPLIVGATLIGLGVIVVVASIVEQPASSKSSPNWFYSQQEAEQYHEDLRENQRMLGRIFGGEGLQGSTQLLPDDMMQEVQDVSSRILAAQEKQATASQCQQRLSRTLNWVGITALAAGCALLLVGRTRQPKNQFQNHSPGAGV